MRTRYPHRRDLAGVRTLLERLGLECDELELRRMLGVDPQRHVAIVATTLAGRLEAVAGFGFMDRFAEDPDLVVADEELAPGAGELVELTLLAHAQRARRIA